MVYIDSGMIEAGLKLGLIRPQQSGQGLIAYIGEHWFFFGGIEFENANPDNLDPIDLEIEIKSALDSFRKCPDYETEYAYYYWFLKKNIPEGTPTFAGLIAKAVEYCEMSEESSTRILENILRELQKQKPARAKDPVKPSLQENRKTSYQEDILTALSDRSDCSAADFTEEELDKMAIDFERALARNDAYSEAYWLQAHDIIDEYLGH